MIKTMNVLFLLTLIQFWWIAIWGLAYILIDYVAGESKIREVGIYTGMLILTIGVFHFNPQMVERL
jgi:succinate dehydrogenase hydrophobic anchor subunit